MEIKTFKDLEFTQEYNVVKATCMFDNGYGISVAMGPFTKGGIAGLYQITPLKFIPQVNSAVNYFNSPVANDTVGHLKQEEVTEYMKLIQELPK
jgi:hypothetical protein